ncbi:MAG TPA: Gfo/Idh/MocA family oxidoreductase [Candidatus Baltobacteraceae bacterium]|nr:Gfo/Idh/MocA family oxidoreductase [Candidatus Baltobacteraceae bacterium]
MKPVRFGLVGFGYWGPNYAKSIAAVEGAELTWCADVSDAALARARELYPHLRLTKDVRELASASDCDAVIVAAPTSLHDAVARVAIGAGKPVLVEKPLTDRADTAEALARDAAAAGALTMTGHIYTFNPAVAELAARIRAGELGAIRAMTASRMAFSPIRPDVDALWDLAPHDVAMFLQFAGALPVRVFAARHAYMRADRADVVFATLEFASGAIADLRVSWDYPFRERVVSVVGSRGTVVFDDGAAEKLTWYRAAADAPDNRDGTVEKIPHGGESPLVAQIRHFAECVRERRPSPVDFDAGARVVRVLGALTESAERGAPVALEEAVRA